MDEESEVIRLEALCKELYESQDAGARAEAEKALVSFQNSPESLGKCQRLLDRGNSPYAQLLATTTITKLISRSTQTLNLGQRIDIRNYRPHLSLVPAQASTVCCARAGHSLLSHHQAWLV
eukprot:TRINITY_DN4676_c0_g1_i1.p1 TRINITY_DN4676_c0_g1~~TRINITY_DN4676_c0_g1_i1.p1  ORF type:complete len:121 (+),score=20.50 TRINITY_DN4676_c0_g1_i1:207-569(+)